MRRNVQIMIGTFLFALLFAHSQAILGIDASQLWDTATYTCIKNSGYDFAILRGYRSGGTVDPNAVQGLTNAIAGGLSTDVYLFPCASKNASLQVDEMMAAIPPNLYNKIWIDVEYNPTAGCGWGTNYTINCNFIGQLVSRVVQNGKTPGIYASSSQWVSILGSKKNCKNFTSYSLWYPHYDNLSNFSDFTSFGGWTTPYMKQFVGNVAICGANVDKNYRL